MVSSGGATGCWARRGEVKRRMRIERSVGFRIGALPKLLLNYTAWSEERGLEVEIWVPCLWVHKHGTRGPVRTANPTGLQSGDGSEIAGSEFASSRYSAC